MVRGLVPVLYSAWSGIMLRSQESGSQEPGGVSLVLGTPRTKDAVLGKPDSLIPSLGEYNRLRFLQLALEGFSLNAEDRDLMLQTFYRPVHALELRQDPQELVGDLIMRL